MKNIQSNEKKSVFKEVMSFSRILLMSFVLVFLSNHLLTKHVVVEGSSMYPTLANEEEGFTDIFSILFLNKIQRFDIVVVKGIGADEEWIKRVIALPGEVIEYKDNKLYINGKYIEEKFLHTNYVDNQMLENNGVFTESFGPYKMGDDEYFLMGDNRIISYDSRAVGAFKRSAIESKNLFVIKPFDNMRIVRE